MVDSITAYILVGLGCIAAYLAHSQIGEAVYFLSKRWRESLFIGAAAVTGGLVLSHAGAFGDSLDVLDISVPSLSLPSLSSGEQPDAVAGNVAICRKFVRSRLHGAAYEPEGLSHGFLGLGPHDPWEICAGTFGMNYWKYDISVDGRNGGAVLCELYRHRNAQPSEAVESWCQTVFANPAPPPAKNPHKT
jgi:hypothetical protein